MSPSPLRHLPCSSIQLFSFQDYSENRMIVDELCLLFLFPLLISLYDSGESMVNCWAQVILWGRFYSANQNNSYSLQLPNSEKMKPCFKQMECPSREHETLFKMILRSCNEAIGVTKWQTFTRSLKQTL
jgi:hypothetical protein